MTNKPEILVKYIRDGLIEQEHFGYVLAANKDRVFDSKGESNGYPFFLRSCAKPLQASLLIDYGMDIRYDMSLKEIALCCASHAGETIHVETAKELLKKICLDESYLKCGFHKPISKTVKEELLVNGQNESIYHNNCIGKHIMMLGLCKMNGWDLESYDEPEHQLQIEIKRKIYELCGVKKDYPVTKDGCGVPIHSMPLENMVKGYINLFCNLKYDKLTQAFGNYPYIIGGEDRTDTKVMQNSENLVAKVGAGGLCIVVNLELQEGLIVKISDCDMKARELVVLDSLKNMHWADIEADHTIKTLHNEIVGEIVTCL